MYVCHRNGFKNCNMGKQSSLLKGSFFKRLQSSLYFSKTIFVERLFFEKVAM
jgi:hypothetical protein